MRIEIIPLAMTYVQALKSKNWPTYNLKKIIAYSSVSHMSFIIIGIGSIIGPRLGLYATLTTVM